MAGLAGIPRATDLPSMVRVRQRPRGPELDDVPAGVREGLGTVGLDDLDGAEVAVAVGSRGIADLAVVVSATIESLRERGAKPFVIPAMGSHGGATAEGQRRILEHLGITEQTVGAPVRATMDVVAVGEVLGKPVYLDRHASEAGAVVVVNRVKPHTDFAGRLGSGVLKMLTVGLGNHVGAAQQHRLMVHHGYERTIRATAEAVLAPGRIAAGLAIVENGRDRVALVEAFKPADLVAGEERLVELARDWMARLPTDRLDLLVVDVMGKEISGAGMDSNVIGRHTTYFEPQFTSPRITFVGVCDLTSGSGGNAAGIGNADFMTRDMYEKVDWETTYTNTLTCGGTGGSRMPVVLDTGEEIVRVALGCLGLDDPRTARVARIRDTLALEEIEVSERVWEEIRDRTDVVEAGPATGLAFNAEGALQSW